MDARAPAISAPKRATLYVTCRYPSALGFGTQIRAAALVHMLAAQETVHLLVLTVPGQGPLPRDVEMELACTRVTCLQIFGAGDTKETTPGAVPSGISLLRCRSGEVGNAVVRYARKHGLERLFVMHLESMAFVADCLDFFTVRSFDLDELPSRRETRIAELKGSFTALEKKRIQLSQVLEKWLLPRCHHVFVSSQEEAALLRERGLCHDAQELPNIRTVPASARAALDPSAREILFVGNLEYFPNRDGILWFYREMLPALRQADPSVVLRIVGCDAPEEIRALASQPGVAFSGYQVELAPHYARAALCIVPLRAGAGTRIKILEAFGYGRPVVSTRIGAEGLAVTQGETILLADDAFDFTAACRAVLENPNLAKKLVQGGDRLVRERYSTEGLARCYAEAVGN